MNALFYGFQFYHHGRYSAFYGMKRAFKKSGVSVMNATPPFKHFPEFAQRQLDSRWRTAQEFRVRPWFNREEPQLVHYYFPENTLFRGGGWKGKHKLVLTSHQPLESAPFQRLLRNRPGFSDGLAAADVVLLMASNDIEAYREIAPNAEILSIPYGVSTSFFSPDRKPRSGAEPLRVLTVGNWLRDYKTWADVVYRAFSENRNMEFTVIAGEQVQREINERLGDRASRVRLISGISDRELVEEYNRADLLYLPLEDAWANTALLEAASMALPILVTDLHATREYLGDESAIYLEKGDGEMAWQKLVDFEENRGILFTLGNALRDRAVAVNDWSQVVRRHIELYERVLMS